MRTLAPSSVAEAKLLALAIRQRIEQRQRRTSIRELFPDEGPYARHYYEKHLEFFRAGAFARERLFLAANRVGKTRGACYEDTLHLTGLYNTYAPWWEGHRFAGPIRAWICGTTDEKIKETLQEELFGPVGSWGTGLIPGETIVKIDRASGPIKDLIDTAYIQHATGGTSVMQFKSYKQGRIGFEGTFRHLIHGDEEMPADIKTECLLRTMDTTGTGAYGLLLLTFTPLEGLSETVLEFLPEGELPQGVQSGPKYVVNATWDDVPHLSEAERALLLQSIPAYQRDARTRGLPVLGAGLIYPVPEEDYLVDPFPLPLYWPRSYGLDVGWNRTAGIWAAQDRESGTAYLYHEYYRGQAEPSVHAEGIKAPGAWIPGVIDPAARGRSQADGLQLIQTYHDLGLQLSVASNAVEAGLFEVFGALSSGQLKVFRTLAHWRKECRLYRRDDKGRVVKVNDHLMDGTRYWWNSGRDLAKVEHPAMPQPQGGLWRSGTGAHRLAWMG